MIQQYSRVRQQDGLAARRFRQRLFAAFVVEILKPIEAIPAVAHNFARLADVAELLGQFERGRPWRE
jgi:hypothetical protein